jgi:D-serine deaminase-like pyridoxal phosphate-dependent protein
MLLALKKLYEARIAEHSSIIDIYLQKPVGIGEHDDLLKVLDERFQKLTCAKDNLEKLEKIINGVQTKTETETKTETKK